jgi:hypothetical protein
MTTLDIMQWSTLVLSVLGSYLGTSLVLRRRFLSFSLYMVSNLVLASWGFWTGNYPIMLTQLFFVGSSSYGLWNTRPRKGTA